MQPDHRAQGIFNYTLQRMLFWALALYVVLAWVGGGPTVDVTATDEWLMLLALVPLVLAGAILLLKLPSSRPVRVAIVLALLVPVIPLMQLVSMPEGFWHWSAYRVDVTGDLQSAGISAGARAWSLWPEATTRALLTLLPLIAVFLGALALGDARARRLVPLALALVLANLAFGVFQVGLPRESGMRLYPVDEIGIGGVLLNRNHQGTALIVGMLLAMGLWAREHRRDRDLGHAHGPKTTAYATAALVCLAAVALTGSSGAMIIALVAFASAVLATGLLSVSRIRHSRGGKAAWVAVLGVMVLGLLSAHGWMNLEQTEPLRYHLARETFALGMLHAPMGSGAGTFVDSYAQSASLLFQRGEYINHAHNEFAQWWFEAGWLGLSLLFGALTLLMVSGWHLLRAPRRDPVAVACWMAVIAVLSHSWVEFPLRTLTISSLTALLAGIAIGAAGTRVTGRKRAEAASVEPLQA